jgi:hypothetical protein
MPTWWRRSLVPSETAYLEQNIAVAQVKLAPRRDPNLMSPRHIPTLQAGIQAFMIRLSRPGMIVERFTRNAFRPSDTHCSTLRGFIGMVRGSNPATETRATHPTSSLASRATMETALSTRRSCQTRETEPLQDPRTGFLRTTMLQGAFRTYAEASGLHDRPTRISSLAGTPDSPYNSR